MPGAVKVKCRRCGREAGSNEFVLDPVYKMMVCPACTKERKNKEASLPKAQHDPLVRNTPLKPKPVVDDMESAPRERLRNTPLTAGPSLSTASAASSIARSKQPSSHGGITPVQQKPAGWDAEDDRLEKAYKAKQESQLSTTADGKKSYSCPKCHYRFVQTSANARVYTRCPFCQASLGFAVRF